MVRMSTHCQTRDLLKPFLDWNMFQSTIEQRQKASDRTAKLQPRPIFFAFQNRSQSQHYFLLFLSSSFGLFRLMKIRMSAVLRTCPILMKLGQNKRKLTPGYILSMIFVDVKFFHGEMRVIFITVKPRNLFPLAFILLLLVVVHV